VGERPHEGVEQFLCNESTNHIELTAQRSPARGEGEGGSDVCQERRGYIPEVD
jgi:hypothetical protein